MADEKKFSLKIGQKDRLSYLLAAVTLIGLILKFLLALNIELNSDSVVPGLQAMEILKHGNTFLDSFYFPVNYPAIFTDLVPFHLIPQMVTNYDPNALRLMGFIIYLLTLAVYAAIIHKVTKDRVKALLFVAVFGNLPPLAYYFFIEPVSHVGSVFFCGLMFLLLLGLDKMSLLKKILMALLIFLFSFSDNLFLAIFAIPFALAYLYSKIYAKKTSWKNAVMPALFILIPAIVAYVLKLFLPRLVSMEITTLTTYNSITAAPMLLPGQIWSYVRDLASVTSDQLFSLVNGDIGLYTIIGVFVVLLFFYAARNLLRGMNEESDDLRLFLLFLLLSSVLVFLGYIFTSLNAPRYLMITSLSMFVAIGLGYDNKKLYLALVALVILIGVIGSALAIPDPGHTPNQDQYGLIRALEDNNITFCYADYWDSNIVTYLSNEKVTVRAIGYKNGNMIPYLFLSSAKWYEKPPGTIYLIFHKGHDPGIIGALVYGNNLSLTLQYGDYYIYKY